MFKEQVLLILVISLSLFHTAQSLAQEPSVAELEQKLALTAPLSEQRLPLIIDIIKQIRRSDPKKAEMLAEQGFDILEQHESPKYQALLLGYLTKIHLERGEMSTAKALIEQGLSAAKRSSDKKAISINLFNQALLYQLTDKLVLAIDSYQELEEVYQNSNNKSGLAAIYNIIGNIQDKLGNLDDALAYYQKALPLYEKQSNKTHFANTIMNIGQIFFLINDFQQAEENYLAGLAEISKASAPLSCLEGQHRLGILYQAQGQYAKAQAVLEQAVLVAAEYDLKSSEVSAYYELIRLGNESDDLALMVKAMRSAEQIMASHNKPELITSSHYFKALVAAKQEDWLTAEKHIDTMIREKVYESRYFVNQEALDLAYRVKVRLGKFAQANDIKTESFERYKEQQKTIKNTLLAQFAELYKTSEKERKIAVLEEENAQQQLKALLDEQEKRQLVALQIILALIFVAVFVFGYQRRRALQKEADLTKALMDNKNQMLADISHELRTPFSVLKLQVEALQYNIEQDTDKAHERLHNKISQLTSLIADIDELAQADALVLKLNKQRVDIDQFIQNTAGEMQVLAKEAGLDLVLDKHLPQGLSAEIDFNRIKQVMTNLIGNAIRYTDAPGLINIHVSTNKTHLILIIEDSAPGVPQNELKAIFERLYRVDKSRSRITGGTGLGLSICRSLVELHQGSIKAEQSELGGLKIIIHIPIS
ncbi:tetratricopeptide repeat protein [Catenovulum sp. SM1970]|uniref:ATP-binding protein n=1 Tax=Marinifaba aquimaris TaxID=2741323 RepID=UPI00157231DE|nr:ATP-binding protein [Marinifaba aquimaris]NTS78041.1 tetratricopeptide repeat protein [Marinifaba aquimaris]